jgi:hypothetical protein
MQQGIKNGGAIPPTPHTSSWWLNELSTRTTVSLYTQKNKKTPHYMITPVFLELQKHYI